jgi:N-acetyl-gamma-glutamyl-phosphate reductase
LTYVAGESSAGAKLSERFPSVTRFGNLVVQKWEPSALPGLDLLFTSLPTGESTEALKKVSAATKIVDIGGDHRYLERWTYGLADVFPDQIKKATRVANPGCYPAAALTALAPLLSNQLIDPASIIIDAKSGVSGAGRGGGSTFGYAEVNEDVSAYGLLKHTHVPEINKTVSLLGGAQVTVTFTPHLIPMTRGILATCYCKAADGSRSFSSESITDSARKFYDNRPFVRVTDKPPHTKWATGSNLAFVHFVADPERNLIIALSAIDNLGKGAAGQAMQNANLMLGLPEDAGLGGASLWP